MKNIFRLPAELFAAYKEKIARKHAGKGTGTRGKKARLKSQCRGKVQTSCVPPCSYHNEKEPHEDSQMTWSEHPHRKESLTDRNVCVPCVPTGSSWIIHHPFYCPITPLPL